MSAKRKRKKPNSSRPKGMPRDGGSSSSARARRGIPSWFWTSLGVLLAFIVAFLFVLLPTLKSKRIGKTVVYTVPSGATLEDVAQDLAREGIVPNEQLFRTYVTLRRPGSLIEGVHLFTDGLSIGEVTKRLTERGGGERVKVTIPEGFTRFDIGKRLESSVVCPKDEFLRATSDVKLVEELRILRPTVEGFLFPSTYELPADSRAEDVVRRMVQEFEKRYTAITERHASSLLELERTLHFGREEIVTLASVVEKEAVVDEERAVIAGVFFNRLRDPNFETKGKLQSDPTSGYGCLVEPSRPACADFHGKITAEMNRDPENRYSTYTHAGLPPGPIASPGTRSIAAVLAPATHRYFYFVAKGGGRHTFSETYAAHNAAIEEHRH